MEERHTTVGGIRMRWLEGGAGPPVILVHGIPTSPELWREVIPRTNGARSLAWEMVGYGGSIREGAGRDISVARQADYLLSWLDAVAIDQAVFVGHDLGGGVAQIVAVRHPSRCAGVVLTNSIAYDSWPIPRVKVLRAMGGLVERLPDGALKLLLAPLFYQGHEDAAKAREAMDLYLANYRRADGTAALVRQIRSLDTSDTTEIAPRLPELDIPTRLVWGEADRFQKVSYAERLSQDLRAPLDRIPEGRHFVPEDHPDRIAKAVNELVLAA